jgi:hypothetical protein
MRSEVEGLKLDIGKLFFEREDAYAEIAELKAERDLLARGLLEEASMSRGGCDLDTYELAAKIVKGDKMKDYELLQIEINHAVEICHALAKTAGWWKDPKTSLDILRPVPELLCLIHSEVSEALEGYRKDLMDDKVPHRKMLEVELADTVIRIFDMAGGYGLDIGGAMRDKLLYNSKREDHKLENRGKDGGKRI